MWFLPFFVLFRAQFGLLPESASSGLQSFAQRNAVILYYTLKTFLWLTLLFMLLSLFLIERSPTELPEEDLSRTLQINETLNEDSWARSTANQGGLSLCNSLQRLQLSSERDCNVLVAPQDSSGVSSLSLCNWLGLDLKNDTLVFNKESYSLDSSPPIIF